ncbi:uncharacterized protein [Mytilus edulis]|uniref:uncharacterized protein n=1 Tax=Mytilus edulis TaxID=6550 RepID=UPI0039EF2916
MNTYVTHPSVRIKGTENNLTPLRCADQRCGDGTLHMHCPFCVKTELYHDPVILKAHYRVKHVDKGIDFAGLKILRCCDHCDIVGIIKGEKKFKGAHWHCYKCRNGFNRRDEAIKHYKTHFRNPQTTFQIQIAQEVYPPKYEDEMTSTVVDSTGLSIHPALTEAVMSTSVGHELAAISHPTQVSLTNVKSGEIHTSVAAEETVDSSNGQTHHIMIIQEEPPTQVIANDEVNIEVNIEEEKEIAEDQNTDNQLEDLKQKYKKLEVEKILLEQSYKSDISELQSQVNELRNEIADYQKREQDYLEQLSVPLDKNIENILKQMENQHRSLLHQHLLNLKREYKPVPLILNTMSTENHQYLPQNSIELVQEVSPATSMCSSTDNVSSSNLDMPTSMNLEETITQNICNGNNDITDESSEHRIEGTKVHFEKSGSGDPFVVCIQYEDTGDPKCANVMVEMATDDSVETIGEPMVKRVKIS